MKEQKEGFSQFGSPENVTPGSISNSANPPQEEKTTTERWEKEFLAEFADGRPMELADEWDMEDTRPSEVLAFIRQLLSSERQRMVEKVENWANENDNEGDYYLEGYVFVAHLLEFLSLLSDKEELK